MTVVVIANKWWEVTPLMAVLQHCRSIKPEFSASPVVFNVLDYTPPHAAIKEKPRLQLQFYSTQIDVWCIEDLISEGRDTSSTAEKLSAIQLLKVRHIDPRSLVIAFGTAASPNADFAGNVVVGCNVFVTDAKEDDKDSPTASIFDKMNSIISSLSGEILMRKIDQDRIIDAEQRFLSARNGAAVVPKIFASPTNVSVGVVNVSNNKEYKKWDTASLARFAVVARDSSTLSMDTTLGLVRLSLDNPFLFIAGIANRVGLFNEEVGDRKYSQNFVAVHNAAICLAWLLPGFCDNTNG
ncbi:MAG: hypothetical protein R3C20_23625 [Planctomycetaceae bacterium]